MQVSRLGNPLINEVMIPIGVKDKYNAHPPRRRPARTSASRGQPGAREAILNALFNLGIKENGRTDIVQALLTGVPGLTQISPSAVPADTLKFNLGVPPTATPNRFGVLAGDTQGFPNGRRLADDVTDIELRVIAGALLKPEQGGKQLPLGDGVDQNEKPFRTTFPYVAHARQRLRRQVRAHRARPRPGPAAAGREAPRADRARVRRGPRRPLAGGGGDPAPAAVQRPVLTGSADDVPKLQRAVRGGRDDLRPALAQAYLQRVRETGDPSFYARAEGVLRHAAHAGRLRDRG